MLAVTRGTAPSSRVLNAALPDGIPPSLAFHGQHTRPFCLFRHHSGDEAEMTSFNSLSTLPPSAVSMPELGK